MTLTHHSNENLMLLGVCYYPEQWPQHQWESDARRMAELGIRRVRIAEFAWSRMEPEPGRYEWAWLDTVIDVLAAQGLEVVLGTPTATPPRWLVAQHPEILPVAGVKLVGQLPGDLNRLTRYDAAIVATTTHRAEADALMRALTNDDARRRIEAAGFTSPR